MRRLPLASLAAVALLCLLVNPVWASPVVPVIEVGSHDLYANVPNQIVPIMVSNIDPAVLERALEFDIQVGDGGAVNSYPPTQIGVDTVPRITAVDIIGTGTVFAQPSGTQATFSLAGNLIWQASTELPVGESRTAQGVLAYVTVDTTGMTPGMVGMAIPLTLSSVAKWVNYPTLPDGYTTNFGGVNDAEIHNGQINIIPAPEPATLALLLVGAVTTLLWHRRDRTRTAK